MHPVKIHDITIADGEPLAIIAGPCVIESREATLEAAEILSGICSQLNIPFVFKSSYDKANRTSVTSFRGPGLDEGLKILQEVQETFGLPVVTDVHSPDDATAAGEVCDLLQIPAFLCRQTDLLVAAGKTGRPISIKKGQFIAPHNMGPIVEKVRSTGNNQVMLTDRGTCFGYNTLVSDMRAIPIMKEVGEAPVCFDATHSVQIMGGHGSHSGGERQHIPTLAYAAVAAGANCLFLEAHKNPEEGKSDAASMLPFDQFEGVVRKAVRIHEACSEELSFSH